MPVPSQFSSPISSGTPPPEKSWDFCNSFWGPGDDGVYILLSRMRGAMKTTDELLRFWNERALIEEQYAARLAALAKVAIGGEELGELRNSLDALRVETEHQAQCHVQLASSIRSNLIASTSYIKARQTIHKRDIQATTEKKFKKKQNQDSTVMKAKEKYDTDSGYLHAHSQQCTLTTATLQGKDSERAQAKFRKARDVAHASEAEFANSTQVLRSMMPAWEADWKDYCDRCQDLEEDRLESTKCVISVYTVLAANVCSEDNNSFERICQALQRLDPKNDVKNFARKYGTGNRISDPAIFVPYSKGRNSASPPLELIPITRPANFNRISRCIGFDSISTTDGSVRTGSDSDLVPSKPTSRWDRKAYKPLRAVHSANFRFD